MSGRVAALRHFPLTNASQKVTSASSADIEVFGRRTIPLMPDTSPGCCMATCLVCDVTTPILSFFQLRKQGCGRTMDTNNMHIHLDDNFQNPLVLNGQQLFIESTSFCGNYSEQPHVFLPTYSDPLAMVSPAFAKSTVVRVPAGTPITGSSSQSRT